MLEDYTEYRAVGAFLTGLREEEIVKTRPSSAGGLVVVDVVGRKHTYDPATYFEASEQMVAGVKRARGAFKSEEAKAEEAQKARLLQTSKRRSLRNDARGRRAEAQEDSALQ